MSYRHAFFVSKTMKITVLILSGAQDAVLVLEISDFRHMPWVLTCFIILIDYAANKINLCYINLCFIKLAIHSTEYYFDTYPTAKISIIIVIVSMWITTVRS